MKKRIYDQIIECKQLDTGEKLNVNATLITCYWDVEHPKKRGDDPEGYVMIYVKTACGSTFLYKKNDCYTKTKNSFNEITRAIKGY